jgi:hypothetical protein
MNATQISTYSKTVSLLGKTMAIFGVCALALQFYITTNRSFVEGKGFFDGIVQYLGFFTILTNLYATLIFTAHGVTNSQTIWQFFRHPQNLTSAAASIMVVWSVYHLVLRSPAGLQGIQYWADLALHYIIPFATIVFWWLAIPRGGIDIKPKSWRILLWYPLFYLVYVFVRGAILNSYPYFFINVTNIGYARAFINAGGITLLLVGLVLLFWVLNRILGRKP